MTHLHAIATDLLVRLLTTLVERGPSWETGFVLTVVLARLGLTPGIVTKLRSTPTEGLLLVLVSAVLASESGHAEGAPSAVGSDVLASSGTTASDDDADALAAILAKSERFEQGVVMPQDVLTPEELDAIGLDAARATIHSLTLITSTTS